MRFQDRVVVITGGGSGIGRALVYAFAKEGARVAVVDLRGTETVAHDINLRFPSTDAFRDQNNGPQHMKHLGLACDVTNVEEVQNMIKKIKRHFGRIDIYCSNAGIINPPPQSGETDTVGRHSDDQWAKIWQVNVHSHIIAARNLIPEWKLGIGDGIFVITASAAGVLTQIGDASYGVSKAAAVSIAEHMAISHGGDKASFPIQVHCLCPQAVDTPFIEKHNKVANSAMTDGIITAEAVADCTLKAIKEGSFWIFPHPQVQQYMRRKTANHSRWLRGMQKMRQNLFQPKPSAGQTRQTVALSKL